MFTTENLSSRLKGIQTVALLAGVAGLAITLLLGLIGWGNFFQSYLYAFIFWFGISMGCLGLLLIGHLAGGTWAAMLRRLLESGAMVIPVMGVLFIVIFFGMGSLYKWTDVAYLASHPLVAAKTGYLNVSFFIVRAIIYFLIWSFIAWRYYSWSQKQDESPANADPLGKRAHKASPGYFMLATFLMTFASFDWTMSLAPEWFSGLYGVIIMVGQAITATAAMILMTLALSKVNPLSEIIGEKKFIQDVGNFLMAFTLFWAYTNVSQLIIIWSGNVIETNPFYLLRMDPTTPWRSMGAFLMVFHFFVPFVILFSRWVKQSHRLLAIVAAWMLLAQLVNLFFYIVPEFDRTGYQLHLGDITALIGLGGIWIAAFIYWLKDKPLLPVNDPRLIELQHAREHAAHAHASHAEGAH